MDDLGPVESEHRQTLTYPIVWSAIATLVIAGSVFAALNGQPEGGWALAACTAAALALYLFLNPRQQLAIHQHGLQLIQRGKTDTLLWRDVTKASSTYSHHSHADALVDIKLHRATGRPIVLRMNWSNRKQLARRLWELFPPRR
ncbi:MAG TPA: hypothetical protein VGR07_19545 [Thermoanaerobaculia bacterium]|jgi:hypothetical protein|nr:hypothetical protein [Thermoanaerobaculia bacterium]